MAGSNLDELQGKTQEIIALHLGDQQFCIKTISIREIGGWAATVSPVLRPFFTTIQ